jgi:signal peptide peptidase SppA
MKTFPHIISKLWYEPLLITRAKHAAMCRVLESRMHADLPAQEQPEGPEKPDYFQVGKAAVIPVHGVLVRHAADIPMSTCGCGLDDMAKMVDVAMADDSVKRIVFDFRSPGGSVTGIPEMARRIYGLSKPTVGYTDDECCSGALWLATQCQKFYCAESASIGSIGVWCAYLDVSRQLQNEGVNVQAISAGDHKLMGAYWKPLSDDEKKMIQGQVDKIHGQFKSAVNSRRQISDEYMQGQIFDGIEAAEIGLIDGIVDDLGELLDAEDDFG